MTLWGGSDTGCGCFFLILKASVVLASAELFLVCPLAQRPAKQPPEEAEQGSIDIRQSAEAFRRVSFLGLCSRCSHLEIWCIFSFWPRIEQSCVLCLWRYMWSTELDSSGDARFFGAQYLARQWMHAMLQYTWLWANFLVVLVDLDKDPEVFLSVLTQNGEVCSVDASGCGPCMR